MAAFYGDETMEFDLEFPTVAKWAADLWRANLDGCRERFARIEDFWGALGAEASASGRNARRLTDRERISTAVLAIDAAKP